MRQRYRYLLARLRDLLLAMLLVALGFILCVLLALASVAYIGLTILFVDAVQNQPPVS